MNVPKRGTRPVGTSELAVEFILALRKQIGEDNYREACRRNAAETHAGICHSHDFCDANMVMAQAFEATGLGVPEPDSNEQGLWNEAWAKAFVAMVKTA